MNVTAPKSVIEARAAAMRRNAQRLVAAALTSVGRSAVSRLRGQALKSRSHSASSVTGANSSNPSKVCSNAALAVVDKGKEQVCHTDSICSFLIFSCEYE